MQKCTFALISILSKKGKSSGSSKMSLNTILIVYVEWENCSGKSKFTSHERGVLACCVYC